MERRRQQQAHYHYLLVAAFFYLHLLSGSYGITSKTDIQALMQLKASIDPATLHSSSCVGSWDFSLDPCDSRSSSFFVCGIRCDYSLGKVKRVTSISLDGYGYRGTLSPFIANLSALQVLDVSGNSFTGQLPESFRNLRQLRKLDLSGNRLTGIIPASFGKLQNLEILNLARNNLQGTIPATLNALFNLRHLSLYSNRLTGSLPNLNNLENLSYLDASGNLLTGSIQQQLPLSLVQISLRSNMLVGNIPLNLKQMQMLEVVDMSKNMLSGAVDSAVFHHPSLQQLNLAYNRFSSIEEIPLAYSSLLMRSELIAVDMSFNVMRGNLPIFVANIPKLSSLSLRMNMFSGWIPLAYAMKAIVGVQPLMRLYLDGNYLIGILPPPFLNLLPSSSFSASFVNNCLQSCPFTCPFCQGASQRPFSQCKPFLP